MALYPHTITAIAKNTNETSNIVPGAMVSLLDSDGIAVIMYDDAAGSNGSTGKVADTRGQVTVYVEQGEYSLNVNGTANGKFVVSPVTPITEIDTFADLSAIRPLEGQTFVCTERSGAKYIVQPSGYAALAGDVTFANGRVGELQMSTEGWNFYHFNVGQVITQLKIRIPKRYRKSR